MRKIKLFSRYLFRLGVLSFLDYLIQRFVAKRKILSIRTPNLNQKVLIRNIPNDIRLFSQIFIDREYDIKIENEVDKIIDCGANIGLASLFFLSKFPNAKIIAIEPEENNFEMLKRNLSNFENVTCLKKGIWNKTANLEITNFTSGEAGFVVNEFENSSANTIQGISIADLMSEFKLDTIDILKIDIEGSEEQVFLEVPGWINDVKLIFCEIHEIMKPGLTQKITFMLSPYFNYFMNGEYYVFKHK